MEKYDALIGLLENSGFDRDAEAAAAIKELIAERDIDEQRIADLMAQIGEVAKQRDELLAALEKLARLGNGDQYGNSDGNMIARAAIASVKESK